MPPKKKDKPRKSRGGRGKGASRRTLRWALRSFRTHAREQERAEALRQEHVSDDRTPPCDLTTVGVAQFKGLLRAAQDGQATEAVAESASPVEDEGDTDQPRTVRLLGSWLVGPEGEVVGRYDAEPDPEQRALDSRIVELLREHPQAMEPGGIPMSEVLDFIFAMKSGEGPGQ